MPVIWRKVKNIIRQNKKATLQEFLFGSNHSIGEDNKYVDGGSNLPLEETIQNLQNQITSLQVI